MPCSHFIQQDKAHPIGPLYLTQYTRYQHPYRVGGREQLSHPHSSPINSRNERRGGKGRRAGPRRKFARQFLSVRSRQQLTTKLRGGGVCKRLQAKIIESGQNSAAMSQLSPAHIDDLGMDPSCVEGPSNKRG